MKLTKYFALIAVLFIGCVSAQAQGFYYNYYLDGQYIGTVSDGYPASGACNSITVWNSLDGVYLSGGSAYPNEISVTNSAYATPGNYPWYFGFDIEVADPLGGCGGSSWSETLTIGVGVSATNYLLYAQPGACNYEISCGTVTPTCGTAQGYQYIARGTPPCTTYYLQQFWSLIVNGSRTCYPASFIPPNYYSGGQNVSVACD